jgi:DNA-binding NarL/FixJ family response regulator
MTLDILLADDHVIFRQGLAALMREQPGWRIVGEAGTGSEAVELALKLTPDVVILDVEMPEMDGIEAARRISAALPATRIVALSMYDNVHYRQRMQSAAAIAYVRKSQPIDELVAAISASVRYRTDQSQPPVNDGAPRETASAMVELNALSDRERDVLRMLGEGQRMTSIAAVLGISVKTVETYRSRLQQKLGIEDLPGLVRFAIRSGLISPEK